MTSALGSLTSGRIPAPADGPIPALLALSRALHRRAVYSRSHPRVEAAWSEAFERLAALLCTASQLRIGVTPRQLLVNGAPAEPANVELAALASWLFGREVAAIVVQHGLTRPELDSLLEALATTSSAREQPGPDIAHVGIQPLPLQHLEGPADHALPTDPSQAASWERLAGTVLPASANPAQAGTAVVARAICQRIAEPGRALDILRALRAALDWFVVEHRWGEEDDETMAQRIGGLLGVLPLGTLHGILSAEADLSGRWALLEQAVDFLPIEAVLHLLQASTGVEQCALSPLLLHLLEKLASHPRDGSRPARPIEDGFRHIARLLVRGWSTERPGDSPGHVRLPNARPNAAPLEPRYPCEPMRLVHVSLECGVFTPATAHAVATLSAAGFVRELLDLADHPDGGAALGHAVVTAEALQTVLAGSPCDWNLVGRMSPRLGPAAAPVLVDALEQSKDRGDRRRLIELISRIGDDAGPLLVRRLEGAPWYLQRNLLTILGYLRRLPEGFLPLAFLEHKDRRVAAEALRLALKLPAYRDRAICEGLASSEAQLRRAALATAAEGCPPEAAPALIRLLRDRRQGSSDEQLVVRALGQSGASAALPLLLELVVTEGGLLGRKQIAPISPLMLTGLEVLARCWAGNPEVAPVLALAAKHRDSQVRTAVQRAGAGSREGHGR